jgi:hypothetical protein
VKSLKMNFYSKLQDLQNEGGLTKTWYVGAMIQGVESTWEIWRGALPVIDDIGTFLAERQDVSS